MLGKQFAAKDAAAASKARRWRQPRRSPRQYMPPPVIHHEDVPPLWRSRAGGRRVLPPMWQFTYRPAHPPRPVAPMPRPVRAAVGSAPMPPVSPTNTWTPGGPFVSVGGTVAVAAPVHRFMSKHALRRLLFIGTGLFILGIALYSALVYVASTCPSSADVATCSSSANTAVSFSRCCRWWPGCRVSS